jgi:hypothetical protein
MTPLQTTRLLLETTPLLETTLLEAAVLEMTLGQGMETLELLQSLLNHPSPLVLLGQQSNLLLPRQRSHHPRSLPPSDPRPRRNPPPLRHLLFLPSHLSLPVELVLTMV